MSEVDQLIVRAYLAGKGAAWRLVESWIKPLVMKPRWCFPCDPEDVLQEIYVALHRRLPDFRGESSLKTYVCTIAFRICVNNDRIGRRRRLEIEIEKTQIASHNPGPLSLLVKKESAEIRVKALAEILARAEPKCIDLWVMHYWGRLSYQTIAMTLGIAVNTVKTRASRCREKVRRALGLSGNLENS